LVDRDGAGSTDRTSQLSDVLMDVFRTVASTHGLSNSTIVLVIHRDFTVWPQWLTWYATLAVMSRLCLFTVAHFVVELRSIYRQLLVTVGTYKLMFSGALRK